MATDPSHEKPDETKAILECPSAADRWVAPDVASSRIPWDGASCQRRAKHFANALKIRIHLEAPVNYQVLARNEAHIRLSSSTWFVCRVLIWASVIGLLFYLGVLVASHFIPGMAAMPPSPVMVGPVGTILLAWLAKWAIERALHYQREREVLFILETAHWLCISGHAKMFEGLGP